MPKYKPGDILLSRSGYICKITYVGEERYSYHILNSLKHKDDNDGVIFKDIVDKNWQLLKLGKLLYEQ